MKRSGYLLVFLATTLCFPGGLPSRQSHTDRQAAVAGQFYPAEKSELTSMLRSLYAKAAPSGNIKNVVAVISPHAGYIYCGDIIASAFNQIDRSKHYQNIFILGPSHYVGFNGAAVYTDGDYVTPLGVAKVNTALAKQLVAKSPVFSGRPDAHLREHSVEVEIPFLQYSLRAPFTIVPIVVGGEDAATCHEIADALRPYLTTDNLFIISSDFSHYPPYEYAQATDKSTTDAILKNSPQQFLDTLAANDLKNIPNLATSACGASPILTLLSITESNPRIRYTAIAHKNSGDADAGDKSRVVGYYAIAVSLDQQEEAGKNYLGPEERSALLKEARETIEQFVRTGKKPAVDADKLPAGARKKSGVFVTIRKNNELRGCIGRFEPDEPIYRVVQEMAIAAATQDPRFSPVRPEELASLNIAISVLTPLKKISSIEELQLGRDGIYMRKGFRSGTFLPEVAGETGWTKEEFLGHCAQDKAGIGWDGWKDAELYTYTAIVFQEKK
jgi:AmmeMemoRadiSam system protein B/AmmeMemoRadiSam system protein A